MVAPRLCLSGEPRSDGGTPGGVTYLLESAPTAIWPLCRMTVGGIPILNRASWLAFGPESNLRPAP